MKVFGRMLWSRWTLLALLCGGIFLNGCIYEGYHHHHHHHWHEWDER